MRSVKDRLIEFLAVKGLSQKKFSEATGLSNGFVNNIRVSIQPKSLEKITNTFPDLNPAWLLTGEGSMLNVQRKENTDDRPMAPVFSLDVVAGFDFNTETGENIERYIPWDNAQKGDFAVHVKGNSMYPAIPDGGLVLLRPAPFGDIFDIDFGKVHAVCLDDDRTLLKVLKPDPKDQKNVVLTSLNPDYPPIAIPITSVRRLYIAKSVKYDI